MLSDTRERREGLLDSATPTDWGIPKTPENRPKRPRINVQRSLPPYSDQTIKESLGLDWKVSVLEHKVSIHHSSATITM